jgi:hypothetical protein
MNELRIAMIAVRIILLFLLAAQPFVQAISMIYNFRIAQVTKQAIFENSKEKRHELVFLIFDQYRRKYDAIKQQFVGGFGSYIYNYQSYYGRVDAAFSHIKETYEGVIQFSGTEADDVLFTVGKNIFLNQQSDLTFSGFLGIPTHRIFRLQHVDFGYSQIGLGLQCDGQYQCNKSSALLYGARYIHFIPRAALDSLDQRHIFTIGTIFDLLTAYKRSGKNQGIELGYTARFRFGAHASPPYDDIVTKTNYIRSNFYAVYKYKFIIGTTSQRLLFNIAYGFDHKPKIFGNKYIITLWGSWNISF